MSLGELAKGYRSAFTSQAVCAVRVETLTPKLPVENLRFAVTVEDASGKELNSAWIGGNTGRVADDLDVAPGAAAAFLFGLNSNEWPEPKASPSRLGDRFEFKLTLVGRTLHARLAGLASWIETAGLAKDLRILDICTVTSKPEGACRDAADLAAEAAQARRKPNEAAIRPKALLGEDDAWLRQNKVPAFVLIVRPTIDRDQLELLEAEFERRHGIDLWQKVLSRLTDAYNRPGQDFVISANVSCSSRTFFVVQPGELSESGTECDSASFGAKTPEFSNIGAGGVAGVKLAGAPSFDGTVSKLMLAEFGSDARISYLERDDYYAEMIVRGVKGVVVPGGNYWERLQLNFLLREKSGGAPATLRVIADGRLAASIGGYPPDSQFTEDIELKHGQQLSEFTKCIATGAARIAAGQPYNRCH